MTRISECQKAAASPWQPFLPAIFSVAVPTAADPMVDSTATAPMADPTVDPVVLVDLADLADLEDLEDLADHRLDPIPESNHSPTCQAKEHGTTRQEDSILLAGSISSVVLP